MAGGFRFSFISDVASFLKGTKDVEESLSKVSDALDGVGDGGAESVKKLEREFSDAADKLRTESSSAGKAVGDNISRGTKEAAEGTRTLKENAGANATEVAASFDGSAQSIAQGFQGLAAEAFEGFGPAGIAAGVAAAAGMGLVTKALDGAKEKAQATAEQVADIASELIDLGSRDLGASQVNDKLKQWASTAEDGKVKLRDLADETTAAGINFEDYARGLAGDSDAAKRSYDQIGAALDGYNAQFEAFRAANAQYPAAVAAFQQAHTDQVQALLDSRKALEEQDGTLNQAAGTADLYRQAIAGSAVATDAATKAQSGLNSSFNDTPAAVQAARDAFDSYAQQVAGQANLSGLLAAAWDDPSSPLRKWAEAQAKATKTADDTWKDFQDKASPVDAVKAVIAQMDQQIAESTQFEANLKALADRGFQALAAELLSQGDANAKTMAAGLAKMDDPDVQKFAVDQGTLLGKGLGQGAALGVTQGGLAAGLQQAINDAVDKTTPPSIDVTFKPDDSALRDLTTPANAALTRASTPDLTTPSNAAMRPTAPATVVLADNDRYLIQALITAASQPIEVTVPVVVDGQQIAQAVANVNRQRAGTGLRPY